jgi:hypothetical protein
VGGGGGKEGGVVGGREGGSRVAALGGAEQSTGRGKGTTDVAREAWCDVVKGVPGCMVGCRARAWQ